MALHKIPNQTAYVFPLPVGAFNKILSPLIIFKRNNLEKVRSVGNKMDANVPHNYGIFKKPYSSKNAYDKFSVLNNRKPVDTYYATVFPDYVTITYSCAIYTYYIEQMNKIMESINRLREPIRNMGPDNQAKVMKYIQNLTKLSELCE
jgi:hypothetical protein